MQPRRWQEKHFTCRQLLHLLFLYAMIFFLIGLGTVLVLSAMGNISATWAPPLTAGFVALSALFGFLQWFVPRSPIESPSPARSKPSSAPTRPPISVDPTLPKEEQAYNLLLERLRLKARRYSLYYPSDGILLIRAQKTQVNTPISISLPRWYSALGKRSVQSRRMQTHIRQYTLQGHPVFVAIFDRLSPGTCHIAYGSPEEKPLADTSIVGGEVTEMDVRKLLPAAH